MHEIRSIFGQYFYCNSHSLYMHLECFHTWFDCLVRTRVCLLPPPPAPMFILVYLGLNCSSFASSSQQLFTPLLRNDGAGEGVKMHNIALHFYIFKFFNSSFCLQSLVHNDTYACLTNVLQMLKKNTEGEQKWDIQLSASSASVTFVRKVSESHTFLSNNT